MDGLKGKDYGSRNLEKSRSIAQYLSLIAGLGHIYLGKMKMGSALLGLFLFSLLLFLLSYHMSVTDLHGKDMLFVYALTAITFSTLWSLILISDVCDKMGLSFEVELLRNYRVSNVQKCERILMISTSICLMILAFLFISLWDLLYSHWICIGISLIFILPMYYFATRKIKEQEFVRLFL